MGTNAITFTESKATHTSTYNYHIQFAASDYTHITRAHPVTSAQSQVLRQLSKGLPLEPHTRSLPEEPYTITWSFITYTNANTITQFPTHLFSERYKA